MNLMQNICGLGDLRAWTGISGQEIGELRLLAHVQNLDIDLSSHQILRRFLGLSGEERETMINLLTGNYFFVLVTYFNFQTLKPLPVLF